MIPRFFNNPAHKGPASDLPKLAEEAVLPLTISQPLPGFIGVRGSNRVAPHGLHRKPILRQAEMVVTQPKVLENFELEAERAVPDYGSSGSDHDPSSVSLFAMVHEFIENEGTSVPESLSSDSHGRIIDSNKDGSKVNGTEEMTQAIQSLAICSDRSEEALLSDVQKILADLDCTCDDGELATVTHGCLKRMVMSLLQERGYNAAICKSKWDHLCGIPAGDYEYIDVHLTSDALQMKFPKRLIVDIDFRSQFEIARPTDEFSTIWRLLPVVFVGRAERLKRIVSIMSEATKQSLRVKGLHLPPWRKPAYMKAKWFSSYKRTSNMSSGRLCKEADQQHANALGFAVRGGGLDAKYTNALELLFHDTGSNFLNRGDEETARQREGDQITVISTEWQPPAVTPRSSVSRKQGTTNGLSSLFLHGHTSSCKEMIVQAA